MTLWFDAVFWCNTLALTALLSPRSLLDLCLLLLLTPHGIMQKLITHIGDQNNKHILFFGIYRRSIKNTYMNIYFLNLLKIAFKAKKLPRHAYKWHHLKKYLLN